MNLSQQLAAQSSPLENEEDVNLAEYFDILIDSRWLIFGLTAIAVLMGAAYAFLARPIYEANLMVQVEDSEKSAGSFLGDAASSLFDVKTPAAGEIEIIRSRMILAQAVENSKLYIDVSPRYVPIVGRWLSRKTPELSEPGVFGYGGFVHGSEDAVVPQFEVPAAFEGTPFTITIDAAGGFALTHPDLDSQVRGVIGKLLDINIPDFGKLKLLVSSVNAKPGAQFRIVRYSKQLVLNALQDNIKVIEKGKQSGVIDVSWQNADSDKLTLLLNEIGRLYVRQNIERKAAEAEKTLGFLNNQLPEYKKQLERAEDIYNRYRNLKGTVSLDDEAKNALGRTVELQSKLLEAQQKRRDLTSRFTEKHPAVQTIDAQIAALNSDIGSVNAEIKKMPLVQQDTVRMQRDIKVNTDLYVSLLNSSLQMNLAKEGKVGNVRILDEAIIPEEAVRPKKPIVIAAALLIGLILGVIAAILKNSFFSGVRSAGEIESHTGLNVYNSIPLSPAQAEIDTSVKERRAGLHLLVTSHPDDAAIESMRSLRTTLQFAMLEAPNNRILISGGTPGVGKSFVSANLAAIIAAAGKKVLLIDADLRKGYINQVFSTSRSPGLSEVIAGSREVVSAIHTAVAPGLDLITTGVLPPNPAELLMSESFSNLLDSLSPLYDFIIIDTAPVLVASDTAAVAPHAGTILLVARAEKTHLGELNESVRRLMHVGSAVNGVILNAVDTSRRHYGSYGYKYGGYKYTNYKYAPRSGD